jgi:hypothetical protein
VKLLLDQGLARSAVEALDQLGLEATHTGAIGMATASDQDILDRARREGETVVTRRRCRIRHRVRMRHPLMPPVSAGCRGRKREGYDEHRDRDDSTLPLDVPLRSGPDERPTFGVTRDRDCRSMRGTKSGRGA